MRTPLLLAALLAPALLVALARRGVLRKAHATPPAEQGAMPEEDDAPFRPRLRRRAFLHGLWQSPSTKGRAMSPLVLAALAGTLFCFWQVFRAFGGMSPEGGSPLAQAKSPIVWFLLGAACAALIPFALERRVERKAALKPGALREMAREAWAALVARVRRKAPPAP
jgi:hypothetical protein